MPNLLFIWTDEQQYFTMGAYGNNLIQTPNMDRLASQSFVFEKAYVTQPLCTPNRAAVMTGLYPHTTGCINNNIPLPEDIKTLPEIIGDPDYKTAYMGKWHLGDEIFIQRGFDEWVSIEDNYIQYYQSGRDREARSDYHHWLVEKGYAPNTGDNTFSRSYAASLPLEHSKPRFLEENAIRFLEEAGDQPFILYVNFLEPHMPFTGPLDTLYAPEEIPLPENFNVIPGSQDPQAYRKKYKSVAKKYGDTESDFKKVKARYWGLVTQVDMSVGVILDKLESLGLSDNTIVVFTSDHGDMMGSHQLMEKGIMYEEAIRIPLIIKDPGLKVTPGKIEGRVSQIDLVPTLLELMGGQIPDNLQGESLVPVLKGEALPDRDIFVENNTRGDYAFATSEEGFVDDEETVNDLSSPSIRTIISRDGWKLSLSNRGNSQLFDLNNDPYETNNLINNEELGGIIGELTARITDWQKITGDTIVTFN